jgi:hypothetical protein
MALGVYLISDVDFLLKQNKDLHDYQEIIFQDIYNLPALFQIMPSSATDVEKQPLPRILNRHQRIIVEQTRRQGLKRGFSDPEFSAEFYVDLEQGDGQTQAIERCCWREECNALLLGGGDEIENHSTGKRDESSDKKECPTKKNDGECEDLSVTEEDMTEEDCTEEELSEEYLSNDREDDDMIWEA